MRLFAIFLFLLPIALSAQFDLQSLYIAEKYAPGVHPIKGSIISTTPLTSVVVQWITNGQPAQSEFVNNIVSYQDFTSNTNLNTSTWYNVFETSGGFTIDTYQNNTVQISLANPNNMFGTFIPVPENTFEIERSFLSTTESVLAEEITATWCGWCPMGHWKMDQVIDDHGEQVLGSTLHRGDGLEINETDDILDVVVEAQPRVLVNRNYFSAGPNSSNGYKQNWWNLDDLVREELASAPSVGVSASTNYNSSSRLLTVNADATFVEEQTGDFRISALVIQDGLIVNHSSFYNGATSTPFAGLGGTLTNYTLDRIPRKILGGAWGSAVFPSSPTVGTAYSESWTYTIPNSYDANNMHVIIVVSKYGTGNGDIAILNALKVDFNDSNAHAVTEHETLSDFTLTGKVLLEGPYIGSGMMSAELSGLLPIEQPFSEAPYHYNGSEQFAPNAVYDIVDWVLIEIRRGNPATTGTRQTTTVARQAALLATDGSIISADGSEGISFKNLAADNEYYFCVRHRNHLDVLSGSEITGATTMYFDFSQSAVSAWGNEQLKNAGDGYFLLHSGDFNQDGTIQNTDSDAWEAEPAAIGVYSLPDGDLNGVIQSTDYDTWSVNKAKIGSVEIAY